MVMDMMKKHVALCAAFFASLLWCGCERKPSFWEKRDASAGAREEAAAEKRDAPAGEQEESSAEKRDAEAWRERLNAAAGVARKKGNDKELVKSLNDVAALYAEGLQNDWIHPLEVHSWCDTVAESGAGYSGETVIGSMFLYGTGVKRDAGMAREWFECGVSRPGTQRGNALYMLGMMYLEGDGVEQDRNKALELWHRAANEDHPAALGLLGRAYMEGKLGFEKDTASGLALLEKAANGGNTSSSVYLGKVYAKGEGVEQNMERAMKWYEQAASSGDAHAQYIMGLAYLEGSGVPVDEGKAFNWLRLAAGQNHVNAMLMLSVCYSTGKGTPQSADMAEVWKKKALQLNAEREEGRVPQTEER